uniref:Uncharacterized protein n=1 Tax=Brassica campestris TaxID=3711 RepID=A0A3P5YT53_BRACM|nr:unnamed protein product [Brassica rapa]
MLFECVWFQENEIVQFLQEPEVIEYATVICSGLQDGEAELRYAGKDCEIA